MRPPEYAHRCIAVQDRRAREGARVVGRDGVRVYAETRQTAGASLNAMFDDVLSSPMFADRRIADIETLRNEVSSWMSQRQRTSKPVEMVLYDR